MYIIMHIDLLNYTEGPAMSWWIVQDVPCPHPDTAGIDSSKNLRDTLKRIKWLQTMDGWMELYRHTEWPTVTISSQHHQRTHSLNACFFNQN